MLLRDIGREVRKHRQARGLTQAQLADMAGLSRITVNQLENEAVEDIGVRKIEAILDLLGISVSTGTKSGLRHALPTAARSISTSYRDNISPSQLRKALRTGTVPERYEAHLISFLEELSPALALAAAEEAADADVPAAVIMKNIQAWGRQWKARNPVLSHLWSTPARGKDSSRKR